MPFDVNKWLPLIMTGGQTVGSLLGARAQNKALDKSSDIQAQGSKDALAAMLGMWNVQRNDLAPYRQNGLNAQNELMRLTYRGRPGTPGSPGGPQMPQGGAMSGGNNSDLPQSIRNLMAGRSADSGGVAGSPSVASLLSDNGVGGPGIGTGLAATGAGALGSYVAKNGVPAIGNLLPGLASTIPGALAGPIGAGVGALAGMLISRLGRRGREKTAASNSANELSDWFWKDVYPKYQSGEIDKATLEGAAKQGWSDYSGWVGDTLKDKTVADRSLSSQRGYFNRGLSQFGISV